MEGFSSNYGYGGSPGGSLSPPPGEIMLAEYNPKKRAGRKKFKETRHPVYRGIRKRNSGKWVCETREPNKKTRIWLGTFPTAEMAARAHDVATIALRGRTACLNFADSAWRLHVPTSGDTKEIQQAALRAAEMFRPPPSNAGVEEQQAPQEAAASSSAAPGPSEEGMWMNELVGVGSSSTSHNHFIMDHDDFFEMPEMMMADMYNGMMLPPPGCGYVADDYIDDDADLPLWNF